MPSRLCIFVLLASFALPSDLLWLPLFKIFSVASLCPGEVETERARERKRAGAGAAACLRACEKATTKRRAQNLLVDNKNCSALTVQGCQDKAEFLQSNFIENMKDVFQCR